MYYSANMKDTHPLDRPGIRKCITEVLGISTQAVTNWKAKGEVPIEHCWPIEKTTKGAVTRKDLRPNDWQAIWPELIKKTRATA